MFYCYQDSQLLTADSVPQLLAQLPVKPKRNARYLTQILLDGFFAGEDCLHETLWQGVYRVPLGYRLTHKPDGQGRSVERAWSLQEDDEVARLTLAQAQEALREHLLQAVERCLPKSGAIAVELSGGLDSSSVAALTRANRPQTPIVSFSNGAPAQQRPEWLKAYTPAEQKRYQDSLYDESHWSEQVANALRLERHLITSGYHFDDIITHYADIVGGCTEVLFPVLNHRTYERTQAAGITTLLSGFGGDEVVSQNAMLRLQELRAAKAYATYYYEKFRAKTAQDWLQSLRLLPRNTTPLAKPTEHWHYLQVPEGLVNEEFERSYDVRTSEKRLIEGSRSLHWQRRIEMSQVIAQSYGIDYRFPLADPQLLQFCHALPSAYKRRHGQGRYLLRKTMASFLPHAVAWRADKAGPTAPAAWANLVERLPALFLEHISADYSGWLTEYVHVQKLRQQLERGPVLESSVLRLAVMVMMLHH